MEIKHVLIFGSRGWIGSMLDEYFRSKYPAAAVVGIYEALNSFQKIYELITRHQPSHVICAAGRTSLPADPIALSRGFDPGTPVVLSPNSEAASTRGIQNTIDELQSPDALFRNCFDNILVPQWIAWACAERGIHMSYFGTGCIYHYDDTHSVGGDEPWGEDAPPNFAGSNYSAVKSITDQFFHQAMNDHVLNIRIRLPVIPTAQPKNLLVKILRYDQLYDIPNAYTYLPAFWGILETCMKRKVTGTVNFVHANPVKLSELYTAMIEEVGLTTMPRCMDLDLTSLGRNMKALRSQNAIRPQRLTEELGIDVPDGVAMLREHLRELSDEEKGKFRTFEKTRLDRGGKT